MHRSAAPDKQQRRATAEKDGANVVNEAQSTGAKRAEIQGKGHDERGHYGSAPVSGTDQAKSKH